MEKQQAYYKCQKCGRESCIVHLDERCVFCEQDKKECSHDWQEQGNEETGNFIGCYNCGETKMQKLNWEEKFEKFWDKKLGKNTAMKDKLDFMNFIKNLKTEMLNEFKEYDKEFHKKGFHITDIDKCRKFSDQIIKMLNN